MGTLVTVLFLIWYKVYIHNNPEPQATKSKDSGKNKSSNKELIDSENPLKWWRPYDHPIERSISFRHNDKEIKSQLTIKVYVQSSESEFKIVYIEYEASQR